MKNRSLKAGGRLNRWSFKALSNQRHCLSRNDCSEASRWSPHNLECQPAADLKRWLRVRRILAQQPQKEAGRKEPSSLHLPVVADYPHSVSTSRLSGSQICHAVTELQVKHLPHEQSRLAAPGTVWSSMMMSPLGKGNARRCWVE